MDPKKFSLPLALCVCATILFGCAGDAISGSVTSTSTATPRVRVVVVTATPSPAPALPSASPTRVPTRTPLPTPTPFITPPAPGEPVVLPILMYHHLNVLPPTSSELLRTWTVAPEQFAAQLDYLQAHGFHTVTFKQLVDFFERDVPLPKQPIILTFDDGWIDAYTVAFPALRERNMVGVFFVPTNYATAGGNLFLDWTQAQEMSRAGMEIGGHTISHEDLSKIEPGEMRRQLRVSKAIMEEKIGQPVVALSYPFGVHNDRIVAETRAAGYQAAVILCCGYQQRSNMLFTLPRIRVSYDDSLDDFAKRLP